MRAFQLTLAGIVAGIWVLSRAARRYPRVGWLQPFVNAFPSMPVRTTARKRQFEGFEGYVSAGMPPIPPRQGSAVEHVRAEMLERQARRRNVYVGAEIILFGVAILLGYPILDMMLWSSMTPTEWFFVGAASLLCIVLGIIAIWKNRQ
jgi:hypothetical protein